MPRTDGTRSMFERHLQTAIQILLVALLGWSGLELVNLGKNTAVLQERLTAQGKLINELRGELRDWSGLYYRKSDAERDLLTIRRELQRLDERISHIEERQP